MSRSGLYVLLAYAAKTIRSPGVSAPAATRNVPSTSTTAPATAPSTSTIPENRACVRDTCTPSSRRASLSRWTRSYSNCSEPNAFTTSIAASASAASDAIAPSSARCCRASAFTRLR
jgi:hypothetical protein